jgi:hypothetical protein
MAAWEVGRQHRFSTELPPYAGAILPNSDPLGRLYLLLLFFSILFNNRQFREPRRRWMSQTSSASEISACAKRVPEAAKTFVCPGDTKQRLDKEPNLRINSMLLLHTIVPSRGFIGRGEHP